MAIRDNRDHSDGYEAGLANPETGYAENPFLGVGPVARASEWWRGFNEARTRRRREAVSARAQALSVRLRSNRQMPARL